MDAGALLDLLGNENRRRILRLLSRKPCYVTEISEHLGVSPKAVIDHLRKLEGAGLIESRVDDQRRKYFHIARNLRLEVSVSPHGFGMKSAYPASPSLDLSSCKHLSITVSRKSLPAGREDGEPAAAQANGGTATAAQDEPELAVSVDELAELAGELDELEDLERELSLAQRWVQGRIAGVLDTLSAAIGADDDYLHAEVLAAVAGGTTDPVEISRELEIPPEVVEECLRALREQGILKRPSGEWQLAD